MPNPAEDWDRKYREGKGCLHPDPPPILLEALPLLPRGCALDVAMGAGAAAVFLARRGWRVAGVDFSAAALEKAAMLAAQAGLPVARAQLLAGQKIPAPATGLLLVQADLENVSVPAGRFDLVLCLRYLQRSLFSALARALRPGGVLIYETYTMDQLQFSDGPRNPDYMLRPCELRSAFPSLDCLFYREFVAGKGIATLIARKPGRPA